MSALWLKPEFRCTLAYMNLWEQKLFKTFINVPHTAVKKIIGKRGKDTIKYPHIPTTDLIM
jgi:hypothetical protein